MNEILEPAMKICCAYLEALTALQADMPKAHEFDDALRKFLKDEEKRLKKKVNSFGCHYGMFVNVSFNAFSRVE